VDYNAKAGRAVGQLLASFLDCRSVLRWVVGRIVKPHDIEDIVQETFVRTFEASGKSTIRHPRSFMLRTARNLAINYVKRADNRFTETVEDFPASDVHLVTEPLESVYEAKEKFLMFCRVVRRLPLQCRRAFILKKVYGLSQKEIATYLGINESTVEKHIAKGLLICANAMRDLEREESRQYTNTKAAKSESA
jgi:RNA polymerase sigma factor (sigma-70 family)